MGGAEVDLPGEFKKGSSAANDSRCTLCQYPFREPFSASCKHPSCKSCLAVLFTRNLAAIDKVLCSVCQEPLKLHELKPDQAAQRKLQKFKNVKCKNCNWKGPYNDYIQNHQRLCGNTIRIQCKVLGCGKWLPKDKALDLHRTDDWCPMIHLMKARLSHAEIVHLSMRESWDWTCGLVLRSEKPSVRNLVERLVMVYSALDPKVPIALENDEYAATQTNGTNGAECSNESSYVDSNQMENRNSESPESIISELSTIAGLAGIGKGGSQEYTDEQSMDGISAGALTSGAAAAAATVNGDSSPFSILGGGEKASLLHSGETKEMFGNLGRDSKSLAKQIQRCEQDIKKMERDLATTMKQLESLKKMPQAIAALNEKQTVYECVMATFNKEIMAMNTRMENFQMPSMLADTGILEKLVKANQDVNRSITSLAQSLQKVDGRLSDVESSHSGVFLWRIGNYLERKREAATSNIKSIYSPPFFTSQYGYKLCGRVFLMGDGVGKNTHISLFLTIMKGSNDAVLPWPFKEKITFQLVNQDDPLNKSVVEAFRPDPTSSSFKKPTSERNIGAGCPLFAKIQMIEDPKSGFIKDNTLYLKIISHTSDTPEVK